MSRNSRGGARTLAAGLLLALFCLCALPAQAWTMALPNGRYTESTEDLRVKVPGGYLRLTREFDGKQWYINRNWSSLHFEFMRITVVAAGGGGSSSSGAAVRPVSSEPAEVFGGTVLPGIVNPGTSGFTLAGPLYAMSRNGAWFEVDATWRTFKINSIGRYALKPIFEGGEPPTLNGRTFTGIVADSGGGGSAGPRIPSYVLGFRWEDRNGDWIEFDREGRLRTYGDRTGTLATLVYSGALVTAVNDKHGRPAMTFHYSGSLLTEVRDVAGGGDAQPVRSVGYAYNGNGSIRQVTDVRGNVTTYEYDGQKRLISVKDAANRVRTITWGVGNKVKSVREMDGAETEYEYVYDSTQKEHTVKVLYPKLPADGSGAVAAPRREEVLVYDKDGIFKRMELNGRVALELSKDARTEIFRDERGRETVVQRDEFYNATSVRYPDGAGVSTTYDPVLMTVTQQTNEEGVAHVFEYDELGRRLKATRGAGRAEQKVTTYTLDSRGRRATATREASTASNGMAIPAVTMAYGYDDNDNLTSVTNGELETTRYTYNRQGQVTSITEPSGKVWTYEYDAAGNLVAEETPNHHVTRYAYDGLNDLKTLTDARQKISQVQYDDLNNITKYLDPYGKAFTRQYNGQGLLQSESDAEGRTTRYTYDRETRQTSITDPKGNTTSLKYTSPDDPTVSGLAPTEVSFPTYNKRYSYDARNRVIQEVDLLGEEGLVSSNVYDRVGRPTQLTDANGKTRTFAYDAHGRLVRLTDSLGKTIELTWDTRDNLIQVKDQRGKLLRYEFDKAGRAVRELRPLGQQRSFTYTIDGNLDEETAPNGSRIKYGYDDASRVTRLSLYPAGAASPSKVYDFTYDPADNLTGWSDGTQSATLTYNDNNRLLTETVAYGNGVQLSYAYTYSDAGFKKTLTWPDGTVISYQHDGNGQLEQVTIPNEGSLTVNEWKWLAPQKVTLPGGTTREYTLDGLLNLTGLKVKNAGQQVVTELVTSYGKVNEVKDKTVDDKKVTFTYDDENRVTQAEEGGLLGATETYTLDAAGNRIAASAVSGAWDYDDNGRLTRKGDITYQYDDNGNLTRKAVGTSGDATTITQFRYDELNRLVEVRDGADTVLAQYGYDPFDNRLWKDVAGQKTYFLYSEEGLLAEADAAGQVTAQYGWQPDGQWGSSPLFIKTRFGGNAQPAFAYYHNDQLGTPQRATDKQGTVVWRADYATFGRATLEAANSLTSNLRLAGQYLDAETGLHYNTRRYYDPDTGRYLSEDPLGIAGGWNLYAFAGADPVNQMDPTGELVPAVVWVGLAIYGYYDTYKTITESNGCIDIPRTALSLIPTFRLLMLAKNLKNLNKLCRSLCGCGINSFTPETLVQVRPEGAGAAQAQAGKSTLKPISQLQVGDEVLAFSEWKGKGAQANADERLSYEKVTDIFTSRREHVLVHLTLDSGETLTATEGHPFRTPEGWRDASLLKKGGKLLLKGEVGQERTAIIVGIRTETRLQLVFNLEVAKAHTFFVGREGALVHNAKCPRKPGSLGKEKGTNALRRENKKPGDVVNELGLSKDKKQRLHREIQLASQDKGAPLDYQEIKDLAKELFGL